MKEKTAIEQRRLNYPKSPKADNKEKITSPRQASTTSEGVVGYPPIIPLSRMRRREYHEPDQRPRKASMKKTVGKLNVLVKCRKRTLPRPDTWT